MDDPKKSAVTRPPTQPEDEEPIIELTDEVPEGEPAGAYSDLEKNLLEFERRFGASPEPLPAGDHPAGEKLPELEDLEDLGFLEDDETPAPSTASSSATAADEALTNLEQHLDWLFAEGTAPAAAGAATGSDPQPGGVIEISEFEEQFLDAEEVPPKAAEPPSEPEPEDEETLELLEIEADETDNELIWFDTPEPPAEAAAGVEPQTQNMAAAPIVSPTAAPSATIPAPEAIGAAVSAAAAAVVPSAERSAPAEAQPDTAPTAIDFDSIPMDRIEAAVENVIARSYSGRIEAIIVQAIENAVTREIERLKSELENEPGGRPH